MLERIIKLHNFFVKESRSYVGIKGKYNIKDICYYPIAYCKFMYLSRNDE